jgi:hypothetical protein
MAKYWISWKQPGDDYRPIYDPTKESAPFNGAYWCSGEGEDGQGHYSTMCAVVHAEDEDAAKGLVLKYWPDLSDWRFCDEKESDWKPGDRFQIK